MDKRIEVMMVPLIMLFAAAFSEAEVMPLIQVDNKPDVRIEVVPVDDAHQMAVPAILRSTSLALPPGSFILVNHSATPITSIDVRWNYTDGRGQLRRGGITCDAYVFAPLDPIVEANDLSLITPYGCIRQ